MKTPSWSFCAALAAACALSFSFAGCATRPAGPLELNVVALNDFHGHLEAGKFSYTSTRDKKPATITAGGIDNIGAALQAWRLEDKELMFVGAGDLIGASPAMSSMWADEPTLTAMTLLGMRASSVGNHEFDQGRTELLRQQHGGCASNRPDKACKLAPDYRGAGFTYLAANVIDKATGKPLLPAYKIEQAKGVKVAFIGAVLKGTPSAVLASGIEGLQFTDEADAINGALRDARAAGATVFVVLIHEGGYTDEPFDEPDCRNLKGPIVGIAQRLDPDVRLIVSGHTHKGFQCKVDGRTITQAEMGGHVLSRIKLSVDPLTRALREVTVRNVPVKAGEYPADPALGGYLNMVKQRSDAALARPMARVAVRSMSKETTPAGETPLGDLIADSVLDATREQGVQLAFMNIGGIRRDLDVGADLTATFGQAQVVLPFSNTLVLMELSGAQILSVLERQWQRGGPESKGSMLQVSRGFSYRWDMSRPKGERVLPGSVMLDGVALDPARSYRVAVNNFLAEGGDGFPEFAQGKNTVDTQMRDLDAFVAYLQKQERAGKPAGSATAAGRIERVK